MMNTKLSENFGGGTSRPKKTLIKFMTNTWKMHQQFQKLCEMHTRNLESGSKKYVCAIEKEAFRHGYERGYKNGQKGGVTV